MELGQIVLRHTNTFVPYFGGCALFISGSNGTPQVGTAATRAISVATAGKSYALPWRGVIQLSLKGGKMGLSEHL